MTSEGYHEPVEYLDEASMDRHRAIVSIMEELEAVDWYDQRVQATNDVELAAVLAHNRDEEKEHAALTLEWLRRRDPRLDEELRTYLWHPEVVAEELARAAADDPGEGPPGDVPPQPASRPGSAGTGGPADGSLGIGSLKEPG